MIKRKKLYTSLLLVGIMLLIIILDQAVKWIVASNMHMYQSIEIIEGFFSIHYITNPGMSFSLFSGEGQRWVFMVISPIALIAILVYLFVYSKDKLPMKLGLSFIFAGGFSNMIDRTFYGEKFFQGEVIDMFDFYGIWNAIFNVADAFVCMGAALVVCTLIYEIFTEKRDKRKNAEKKASELNEKMAGPRGEVITPTDNDIESIKIPKRNMELKQDSDSEAEK